MVKFISKIEGARVLLFQEAVSIARVTEVLIDPDNGSFVGLAVKLEGEGEPKYIPTNEIKGFGRGFVLVKDISSFASRDDVVRIRRVLKNNPKIIGARVYYENGRYIGRVEDATVSLKLYSLEKLYVIPTLSLKLFSENFIFSSKMISRFENNRIYIKNPEVAVSTSDQLAGLAPVVE
jgi:sporulation protein YlmC with PRC-barrel domain